jgi:FAD/FMN-containing dehydrogenase/Fe-S oxidoreductase
MSDRLDRATNDPLATQLQQELEGDVLFDPFSRGRYATDASIYQIRPLGVVVPRHEQDVVRTLQIAADHDVPVIPRGAGTSLGGQVLGEGLVIDTSKYLTNVTAFDPANQTVSVEPGIVLDDLNLLLEPHGLFFPVDVATANRATIGGMAGNNSAGARSIRYGHMVSNVHGIDALMADGSAFRFDEVSSRQDPFYADLVARMKSLYAREAAEIARRFPEVARNVAGYNIDRIGRSPFNVADLLVGSEGTLAWFTRLQLQLQPLPAHKVLGVCHFPTFRDAADATQHIVELAPSAVEIVDRTLLDLARNNPAFRDTVGLFVRGSPDALLLVEFSGDDQNAQLSALRRLDTLMADLGFRSAVVPAIAPDFQRAIWEVRKAALNIVMSMKGDGKPVSFIEDCAVPLDKLAEYTTRLNDVFAKHGTTGTWYAHASVGCLHVRPTLNLKDRGDVAKLRKIAEEAHAIVAEYKGSHSGEHGDGIVRSEFLEPMLGPRLVSAFAEVKQIFDPAGRFNPGKIVRPPRMDDSTLLRYPDGYAERVGGHLLDWSEWNGFGRAVEMCNNNGACRKLREGVMCPSYRVTRDEQHVTRGRANVLRLAISGQLGPEALTAPEMYQSMELCVGCKACKRECPTGVDMARMKIEFLHHYRRAHGTGWKERLVAFLPRYAPWVAKVPSFANFANRLPALARLLKRTAGFTGRRKLPVWRSDIFRTGDRQIRDDAPNVVLLIDTFNRYFEPENARAAVNVLKAAGYHVIVPEPASGRRPLCCGRTFLNTGLVAEAKVEARRVLEALRPFVERDIPVVGLEPSCLLTLRDEYGALLGGEETSALADCAVLLEEFLSAERLAGRIDLSLRRLPTGKVLLHGHCHQKAFGVMSSVEEVLRWIPDLEVEPIESGCCGMAGSFGYDADHYDTSMKMAELDLLPAVRNAEDDTWIVTDGTSCRSQILHGAGREARHVVRVLEAALEEPSGT